MLDLQVVLIAGTAVLLSGVIQGTLGFGVALALPWRRYLPGPRFRQAVLVLIAASAVALLVRPFV